MHVIVEQKLVVDWVHKLSLSVCVTCSGDTTKTWEKNEVLVSLLVDNDLRLCPIKAICTHFLTDAVDYVLVHVILTVDKCCEALQCLKLWTKVKQNCLREFILNLAQCTLICLWRKSCIEIFDFNNMSYWAIILHSHRFTSQVDLWNRNLFGWYQCQSCGDCMIMHAVIFTQHDLCITVQCSM